MSLVKQVARSGEGAAKGKGSALGLGVGRVDDKGEELADDGGVLEIRDGPSVVGLEELRELVVEDDPLDAETVMAWGTLVRI